MLIWLPVAGITAAIVGLIIAPITVRLKGLNLGLVTLALVFIGSHLFSNFKSLTGGAGLGRKVARLKLFGIDLENGYQIGDYFLEKNQILYLLSLTLCILCGLGIKNLVTLLILVSSLCYMLRYFRWRHLYTAVFYNLNINQHGATLQVPW